MWGSSAGGHLAALMGTSGNFKKWGLGENLDHSSAVREVNPISYISEDTPPFLIMHGKIDRTVIHQQSILLHDALKANHIDSELILLDNAGHGGEHWENQVPVVSGFFNSILNSK